MKKTFVVIIIVFMAFVFDTNILGDTVYNTYDKYFEKHTGKIVSNENFLKSNDYHNDNYSEIIKETDNYTINNKEELINVYYTAVNKGFDTLTFYCSKDYSSCMDDINSLDGINSDFSIINQLVSVYNSYSSIESSYYNNGRVDIKITKRYKNEDIKKIDYRINEIINELGINNYDNIKDKIKVFHDYIANTNTYDQVMADNQKSNYHSDTAIGTLFEGKSICSGYTDTMSLFLDKLKIKNVRIATEKHVWNAIFLDNKWYHLDLTWDDPVTSDGSNIIQYEYFLISSDELKSKDIEEHNYDESQYSFIKKN
ncbi:MAG: hypothetical protein J6O56_04720 [Bacilli bacterium]|nr:hypothetical protein [Bacilli bacterium]